MRFRVPKPLHGWREFVGEVGIIVLGVLIALGAGSMVEAINLRDDVRAFRETIDHEIGLNLFVYDYRARQFGCDAKRMAVLEEWLNRARSGAQLPPLLPGGPTTMSPYRSAWDNRNAEVFNHLPAEIRRKYAEFYDELGNNTTTTHQEGQLWNELVPYSEPGPLSLADRRAIRSTLSGIKERERTFRSNLPVSQEIGKSLSVGIVSPDNVPPDLLTSAARCRPIVA